MEKSSVQAILFDLDGVLTPTADLHMAAWRRMFTEYFDARGSRAYTDADYFRFLDGKPRGEGIASLLADRGISLAPGGEGNGADGDSADADTVVGLGERKNNYFLALLDAGIEAYPGSVSFLDHLADTDLELAVVSSSKNAVRVLASAGLSDRFEVVVDGLVAAENGIAGKPRPDTYEYAATLVGVPTSQCVVVEDATSGVAAGAAGDFALVVGVDRGAGANELLEAGADIVVDDLAELIDKIPEAAA